MPESHGAARTWTARLARLAAAPLLLLAPALAAAQTPSAEVAADLPGACAGAAPGSAFATRCAEIFARGPGEAARVATFADGVNLDTLGAQGRVTRGMAAAGPRVAWHQLNLFASAATVPGGWSATPYEKGYDVRSACGLLGADTPLSEHTSVGLSLTWRRTHNGFERDAGRLDTDTVFVTLALDGTVGARGRFDVYAGWGRTRLEMERHVSYTLTIDAGLPTEGTVTVDARATARPRGGQWVAGGSWSHDLLGGATSFGPVVRADYVRTEVDPFTESGGAGLALRYERRSQASLTGEAGVELSRAFSTSAGVLAPQFSLSYVHEFLDDQRATFGRFVDDTGATPIALRTQFPDRSALRVRASLPWTLAHGWSLFLDYDGLYANRYEYRHRITLGARAEL